MNDQEALADFLANVQWIDNCRLLYKPDGFYLLSDDTAFIPCHWREVIQYLPEAMRIAKRHRVHLAMILEGTADADDRRFVGGLLAGCDVEAKWLDCEHRIHR